MSRAGRSIAAGSVAQPSSGAAGPVSPPSALWRVLGWGLALLLPLAAFWNAAAYIAQAGNPFVSSDAWYFIDAFLRKAMDEGPAFQDFFVKRAGGMDHAQPLSKALLWLNASWLGLDFVFEALIGLAFAVATFLFILWTTREARHAHPWWSWALAVGALAAVLVTLNAGMVYNWSLVTLNFMAYFLTVANAAAAWRALERGRYLALFLASLLIAFSFDNVALIVMAATVLATLAAGAKLGRSRESLVAGGIMVAAEAIYFAISPLLFEQASGGAGGGILATLQSLWDIRADWLVIARTTLGSTLAHINPLLHYFPDTALAWQGVLAALAALAHAWFWWRAWRGAWNLPVFYAVTIMLLLYGMIAAVLYGRVPTYGIAYLHEPRYVVMYLLGNVALVLMLLGQPVRQAGPLARVGAGLVLAALLALQVPLSRFTWWEGSYLYLYYHSMARQMVQLGSGTVPENCIALLSVCDMPPEERDRAIAFLQRHELNLYSDAFVERYRLEGLVPPTQDPRPD